MTYDPSVPCKGCNNKVPASQLKMDIDLGKMVCPECIKNKHIHKEIEKEVFHKDKKESMIEERRANSQQAERIGHKCASCGFSFKVNPETKTPKNCPYCNTRILSF